MRGTDPGGDLVAMFVQIESQGPPNEACSACQEYFHEIRPLKQRCDGKDNTKNVPVPLSESGEKNMQEKEDLLAVPACFEIQHLT